MSYEMSLSLDLSGYLLTTQNEIHYLHTQLVDTEDALRTHQRMQACQDNDL
jgi:hypothetical protein